MPDAAQPARKRKTPLAIEHEDDDWLPPSALPTRGGSEFIENDYDLM